jgi:hypothetical protein
MKRTPRLSAVLGSAALAVALVLQASPVLAQTVTLSCQVDGGSYTHTYRINYGTGLVEELGPSGQAWTNRTAPNAKISANAIVWAADLMDTGLQTPVPMHWEGTIDRLSGTGWTWWSRQGLVMGPTENFTCSAATKPQF